MSIVLDLDCVNIHSGVSLIFGQYNNVVKGNILHFGMFTLVHRIAYWPFCAFYVAWKILSSSAADSSSVPEQGEGAHCGGLDWLLLVWCQTWLWPHPVSVRDFRQQNPCLADA